jgi:hypothetical protein
VLTLALYVLLGIAAAAGLFVLAARFLPAGEQIAPVIRDEPIWTLPAERALRPADVEEVRLPVALRGYRFVETDLLLDRLGEELKQRDEEIAALRSGRPYPPPPETSADLPGTPDRAGTEPADHDVDPTVEH